MHKDCLKNLLAKKPAKWLNKISGGKISPNAVSYSGLGLHLPLVILILNGHLILAGVGLLLIGWLDLLDGALAREQNKATAFGAWLDATCDRIKEALIFTSLIYYILTYQPQTWLIPDQAADIHLAILATAALLISFLISYAKAKGEAVLSVKENIDASKFNQILSGGLMGYEVRLILLSLAMISQQFEIAFGLIIIGGLLTLKLRIGKFIKNIKNA